MIPKQQLPIARLPPWRCVNNAAGWPPIYLLHQLLTYQECNRLTSPLPVTSSDWPTKNAAGWPPLYIKWLTYQECSKLTSPLPVTSSDWLTKNAAGWPQLYLLHQVIDLPRMQQVDLPSTLWHQVIDLLRLVARLNCVKSVKWSENFNS